MHIFICDKDNERKLMEIKLLHLTKTFPGNAKKHIKDTTAVDDLTIEVRDGELLGLLGPSGCGKSTTLYMISGLKSLTEGEIWFGDEEVTHLAPEKRGIGLVFQNYALYPHLTVYDNVAFPLTNMKVYSSTKETKLLNVDAFLELLEKPYELVEVIRSSKYNGKITRDGAERALVDKYHIITSLARRIFKAKLHEAIDPSAPADLEPEQKKNLKDQVIDKVIDTFKKKPTETIEQRAEALIQKVSIEREHILADMKKKNIVVNDEYERIDQNGDVIRTKRNLTKDEIDALVQEAARLVQISQYLDRKPSELSGGQQQRVAIARALVKKPRVLLLDEPLSNLDARLRIQTREEIRRIQKETGITTVFVTHDQDEAMSICDDIVVMQNGVLMQKDPPQDMYNDPHNLFVAKFLGVPPINVFKGRIEGGKVYVGDDVLITSDKLADNKDIYVGIRPEGFLVLDHPEYGITMSVDAVQTMGRDSSLICSHKDAVSETIKAIIDADYVVQVGANKLGIRSNKIFLFDGETEERIYF